MKFLHSKPLTYKIRLRTDEIINRINSITSNKPDCEYEGSTSKNTFRIRSKNSSMLVRDLHPYLNGTVTQGENYSTLEIHQEPDKRSIIIIIGAVIMSFISFFIRIFLGNEVPMIFLFMPLILPTITFLIISFFENISRSNNIYTIEKLFENKIIKS